MRLRLMRYLLILTGLMLGGLCSPLWSSNVRQVDVRWAELGPHAEGKKVALVLPSGTHVEGKVISVEERGIRLRVKRTSNKREVAKGEQLIPRDSVSLLRITEYRLIARPLLAIGAGVGVAAAVMSVDDSSVGGPALAAKPAGAAAGGILAFIGGYYVGKSLDKKLIDIRIVRE